MSHNDRAWAATRKGLFELRRGRAGWGVSRVSFLGEPVSMLLPPDAYGHMLAALNLGHFGVKLHASQDAGASWHEVATPSYPPQPESDQGFAWKLVQIWALEAADGRVWAGTIPGGLFVSEDFGGHWTLVEALWHRAERAHWFGGGYPEPGIHSICLHPRRPDDLLVGLSSGGAWHSPDAGQSWALRAKGMRADFMPPEQAEDPNIQDPHRIVRCAAQPDVLWCQHHCGIWRSADDGLSWRELKARPSSFGFAVAAHPQDADCAWFVPAVKDERRVPVDGALAVTRTRDGGQSFEVLREGLPQAHCYDLVYRHGLDVTADGAHLLMGSTTGHVWCSSDAGDSWRALPAHLPPIYALRFG